MSRRVLIDCLAFGREGGSLQGELELVSLPRLHDLLTDVSGCLAYRVDGQPGPRDRAQLLVEVRGLLALRCQRCLETLAYPLELRSVLEFVDRDSDLTQEELEDDTKDFLPVQEELDVVDLIEEEILLALPVAPRHDDCSLPGAGQGLSNASPFAVLAGLRGKA